MLATIAVVLVKRLRDIEDSERAGFALQWSKCSEILSLAVDAPRIHELSIARFQHALKRDQPPQEEGGNDYQAKHEKDRSQVGDLSQKRPLDPLTL